MGDPKSFARLLAHTDLVLLCAKSFDPDLHAGISKLHISHLHSFVHALDRAQSAFFLRYVYLPAGDFRTDTNAELDRIAAFVNERPHCNGVELLPYHELGKHKWAALGLDYPLADLTHPTADQVAQVEAALRSRLDDDKAILLNKTPR